MNKKPTVVFFGSFLHYSALVLEKLHTSSMVDVVAVVTTPPKPAGRDQHVQKTHVQLYAQANSLPVFTPEKLNEDSLNALKSKILNLKSCDLFVVAGYGKLLPLSWLSLPTIAPINIHFSLLPKYRGAMPGEWAILMGEQTTGVTLIEMSTKFDTGAIFAETPCTIEPNETRESLYQKLYTLGANLFLEALPHYLSWKLNSASTHQLINRLTKLFLPPQVQPKDAQPYARMVQKGEVYLPWNLVQKALNGEDVASTDRPTIFKLTTDHWSLTTERSIRSFKGWPGVWTTVPTTKGIKRLKLHSAQLDKGCLMLKEVQLEGETRMDFTHILKQHLLDSLSK